MKYTVLIGDERAVIEWKDRGSGRFEAAVDGRVYTFDAVETGFAAYWLHWNGQSLDASVIRVGDTYHVRIGGCRMEVEMADERTLRKGTQQDHEGVAVIRTPMPGKVVRILAEVGTEVASHQSVLVIEAMKMQNEIKSPKVGRVRAIHVAEGATVNANEILFEVE